MDEKVLKDFFLIRIIEAIQEKMNNGGYAVSQLEVCFGVSNELDKDSEGYPFEGYYVAKVNGFGSTPISDVIALEGCVDDKKLIEELDKLGIAYCF